MPTLDYQKDGDARKEELRRLRLKLFGPTRNEVWKKLAEEIGGQIEHRGFWKGGDKFVVRVEPWEVTLDVFASDETQYTRMRAPYVNPDGFRFDIYRRNIFTDLAKKFGFQDVEVGDAQFDHDFIIRGNDEVRLQQLFSNPRLRQLIAAQKRVHLQVRDDEGWFGATFPKGVDELRFMVLGVIKDVDRLKLLYDLFAETLHTLCHIGSAYEDDPGIRL